MFLRSLRIVLFVLLGTSSVCLHAQEPNAPLGPILQRDTTTADTIRIIDHRTLKEIGIYNQDLSDTLMHYYSLLRFPEGTRIHTGQLGGALNNLYNYDESDIGYDSGQNQYNDYHFDDANYNLFDLNRGLFDAHYTIAGQENSLFELNFGRHYKGPENQFRFQYKRINQIGEYNRQKAKNTHLRAGLQTTSLNDQLRSQFILTSNLITQQDNGGVINPADVENPIGGRAGNIDVQLANADTRYQKWSFALLNEYTPKSLNSDSIQVSSRYKFYNQLSLDSYTHRYLDEEDQNNEVIYKDFTSSDSISFFLKQRSYGIQQGVRFNSKNGRLNTNASLRLTHNRLDQRGLFITRNDLVARTELNYLLQNLNLTGLGTINLTSESPEFLFRVSTRSRKWIKNVQIQGQLELNAFSTDLIEQYIVLNNVLQRSYTPESVYHTKAAVSASFKNFAFVHYQFKNIANLRTWDSNYNLQFSEEAIQVHSLRLGIKDHEGWFQYHVWAEGRRISNQQMYRTPELSLYGRVATEFRMFKKNLTVTTGVDCWTDSGQRDIGYFAGLGIFHLADTELYQEWYPDATIFVETKIGSFKFYYLFENVFDQIARRLIGNPTVQFPVSNQPLQGYRTRIGLRWVFRD